MKAEIESPVIAFDPYSYKKETLLALYQHLLLPRLIEEKMLILLRQGKISKWFSGIGQEAVSVGATLALQKEEFILPMHRNLGVFTARELPLERLFAQFQGKDLGFTKGRDRSFHFGSIEHHLVGMISHLGPQLGIADGVALGEKLSQSGRATLVFSGDGGSSQGDFHEALNVAAVWDLPVIFLIENNGYGLSTPSEEQFKIKSFVDKGPGYAMEAHSIDGNNVLEVFHKVSELAESIRKDPRPILLEAMTFRMRGHEEASGTKYVPKKLMDYWAKKDPVVNYEKFLIQEGYLQEDESQKIRKSIKGNIDKALKIAFNEAPVKPSLSRELSDVYASHQPKNIQPASDKKDSLRMVDAISKGLFQAMERHDNLVLMGQDIAEYGGVFKVTAGFVEAFGKDRVRNTPLCESAIVGAALGLSIKGFKAMMEMQFADFVTCGFNQIVNNLAKIHYRWGQAADVVIRMPTGAGVGAGPFHSQSNEAWFFHTPGLKIVYPSTPEDAKGLLLSAFDDPNPVLYFEHKMLYRSISGDVPQDYYHTPIGKARLDQEGKDLSIITYGAGVHWAREVCQAFPEYQLEILDLRSLLPWDQEAVSESVKKCSKVLVLHEDCITGGIGAEIAAWIGENCFEFLDAPVRRLGSMDTPVPFAAPLEQQFLAKNQLKEAIADLLAY